MVTKRKNVFEELLLLSKDLALWQNQVLRLLLNKGALSKTEREGVIMLAKVESGVAQDPSVALPQKLLQSELPVAPQPDVVLRLLAIREASNVNALTSGQILKFAKGMTVLYGENGSGKSSYARVMKKAFRAREGGVDEILPNVYSQAQRGPASAVFDFDENGKVIADTWTDGKPGADRFGRFAVLDSKCARLIITAESESEFLPYGLELFADLASITDEVKEDLLRIAREKHPNTEILNHLRDQTVVGSFIASLNERTTVAELQAKASFSDADVGFLASKTKELNTLERDTPEVIRQQLQREKTALEAVKKTADTVLATISDARMAELKALSDEAEALEKASQAASLRLKDPRDLPGVGSLLWRELMKAAEKYSTTEAYKNLPFPAQTDGLGASCASNLSLLRRRVVLSGFGPLSKTRQLRRRRRLEPGWLRGGWRLQDSPRRCLQECKDTKKHLPRVIWTSLRRSGISTWRSQPESRR